MGGLFSCCKSCLDDLFPGQNRLYSSIDDNTGRKTAANVPSNKTIGSVEVARLEGRPFSYQSSQPQPFPLPQPASVTNAIPQQNTAMQANAGFFLKYDLKEEIGNGSTSKCYKCIRKKDKKEFASKIIDKRQVEAQFSGLLDQFFVEIKVLKALKHPNIIHLEDSYETSDRIYMVMDIMKGGELFDYVVEKGTLSEEEACVIVRKITSAVAHMHGLNIIHRDLKPENLLLTTKGPDAEVKLIDFGLAKEMFDNEARSFLGTRGYLAPEMLQRGGYDKSIDIWALGVIVFVLLCGCLPFDDDSSRITSVDAVMKKFTLRFPRWATNLSASAKDLLQHLLDVNPKTRYSAIQALNHPWVSGKTVVPNNFLQSPSMMLERRKELRSPMIQQALQQGYRDADGKDMRTWMQRKNSF